MLGDLGHRLVFRIGFEISRDLIGHADQGGSLHDHGSGANSMTLSPQAMASVMPVSAATERASAVGAEIAAGAPMPTVAAFCTSSKLKRLDSTTKPSSKLRPSRAKAP